MPGEMNGVRATKLWIDGVEYPVESVRFDPRTTDPEQPVKMSRPGEFECTAEMTVTRTEAMVEFFRHLETEAWKRIRDWLVAAVLAERAHHRRIRRHVRRCWRGKARKRALRLLGESDAA